MPQARSSVLLGLLGAGAIAAGAFGVQTALLPTPTATQQAAAEAAGWLRSHRLVLDLFHVDGARVAGACLRGWFPHGGSRARGSLLALEPGGVWLEYLSGGISVVRGGRAGGQAESVARLEAATGCSGELGNLLFRALQDGARVALAPARVAGAPALALSPPSRRQRVTLYVSLRTKRPLLAVARANGHAVSARLYLVQTKAALVARLRRGQVPRPGGGG